MDDDKIFSETSKQILELNEDFEITLVLSANEALKKIAEQNFDVIVSDYQMPGKDGLDFLVELRKMTLNIPFIMFTGKGKEEIAMKALNLGADNYFNKGGPPDVVFGQLKHGIIQAVNSKKAENSLKESEERFRSIVETSHDGIILIDEEYRIQYVNEEFSRIFDTDKVDIYGKNAKDFFIDVNMPKSLALLLRRKIGVTIPSIFEDEFNLKNNQKRFLEIKSAVVTTSKGEKQLIAQIHDISKQKLDKISLLKTKMPHQNQFDTINEGLAIIDLDGRFIEWNTPFQKMLGYPEDELANIFYEDITSKKYIQKEANIIKKELYTKGYSGEYVKEYMCKDGSILPVVVRAWLIVDDKGRPEGIWTLVKKKDSIKKKRLPSRITSNKMNNYIENETNESKTIEKEK
ncbi:MAG: PAS domain S-box protein [Candidatus Ranarchaeia archaeon]